MNRITHHLVVWMGMSMVISQVNAQEKETIHQLLSLSLEELLEVEVTSATKTAHKVSNAPSVIDVYTAEDIRTLGAETLSDLLWITAGVQIQEKENNRHILWVRGVQTEFNSKTALYLDGIPVHDALGGFNIDQEMPLESVKRIEIIRGPGSALYGANAFSSVINIFTYKPGEQGYNTFKVEQGQDNTHVTYLSLEHDFKEMQLSAEGKLYDADGQMRQFHRDGTRNTRLREPLSLNYARFNAALLDKALNVSFISSESKTNRSDKGFSRDNPRTYKNTFFNLDYHRHLNPRTEMRFHAYYTKIKRFEIDRVYTLVDEERDSVAELYSFTDATQLVGLDTTFTYKLSPSDKLVTGFEFQREKFSSFFVDELTGEHSTFVQDRRYQGLHTTDYGLFLQHSHTFANQKTSLTTGIRYDILDLFSDQLSYRLGLNHAFTQEFFGKFLLGTAYRSPSYLEYSRARSNTPLPNVENMQTFEAQVGYQTKTSRYTLAAFHNQYNDFIARKNSFQSSMNPGIDIDLDTERFINVDDQTMYGVELESRFKLTKHFESFVNVAWLNTHSEKADQELPLLPDWTLAAGLDWRMLLETGEWLLHNHVVVYGDRGDWPTWVWEPGQQQRYPGRTDDFSDGFLVWNLGLHYRVQRGKAKGLDIALTVNNVTDETHYTQSSVPPASGRPARWDTQYDQRHVQFALSYHW